MSQAPAGAAKARPKKRRAVAASIAPLAPNRADSAAPAHAKLGRPGPKAARPARGTVGSFDTDGWLTGVRRLRSPNFDARPPDVEIDLLVIHCISLPPGSYGGAMIEQFFCNQLDLAADPSFQSLAGARVSAHFVIARTGEITQYVSCHARAWHAGASSFAGRAGCNDFSIGVELEGSDDSAFAAAQYRALGSLTRALRASFPIAAVRGHSDIAPERKKDPGRLFDWRRFAHAASLPAVILPPKNNP